MLKKLATESFGEYITRLRKSKGYSQRKLAQITGISNTTISRIEKNFTTNPDLSTLKLLAKYLDIDEIYMLEAAGYKEESKEDELTKKDERDIKKVLDNTKKQLEGLMDTDGLMFDGEPASDETIQSILQAMEMGMALAKQKNKEKYTPKKYKKDNK